MTRMDAMIIASRDDIHLEHVESGGKHGFWITLGEHHRPLLTSNLVWDSEAAAIHAGQDVIDQCKMESL